MSNFAKIIDTENLEIVVNLNSIDFIRRRYVSKDDEYVVQIGENQILVGKDTYEQLCKKLVGNTLTE